MRCCASLMALAAGAGLAACAPIPGIGPPFGPDLGATLLVLALIGLFAFGVIRLQGRSFSGRADDSSAPPHNCEPAIQVLRKRYASGEISREVYLKTLDDLRSRHDSRS
jgi:uncharacterized membrane protein